MTNPSTSTSSTVPAVDSRPPSVLADVEYLGEMRQRPRFHMGEESLDRNVTERVTVEITDGRPRQSEWSLDRDGFGLVAHRTSIADYRDPRQIQSIYRPELERIVLEVTGASRVIIAAGGVVRLAQRSADFGASGTTYPAKQVHSDYTRVSGPAAVRSLLPADEAPVWLAKRYAVYSLWRAFSQPPQDVPLALCEAPSVAPEDAVLSDVVIGPPGKQIVFEGCNFRYNRNHRWIYFRDMHRDELLLIKAYDSDERRAWRVPHTGFLDPSAPSDAPPRESVDIRAVAFFESEAATA
jgi:hypothetical protein